MHIDLTGIMIGIVVLLFCLSYIKVVERKKIGIVFALGAFAIWGLILSPLDRYLKITMGPIPSLGSPFWIPIELPILIILIYISYRDAKNNKRSHGG